MYRVIHKHDDKETIEREIASALASIRRPRLGTWPTFPVGACVDVRSPTIGGEITPDGYEGTWYVIDTNSRDGDHLLDKSPHGEGRVWIHVSRLSEH